MDEAAAHEVIKYTQKSMIVTPVSMTSNDCRARGEIPDCSAAYSQHVCTMQLTGQFCSHVKIASCVFFPIHKTVHCRFIELATLVQDVLAQSYMCMYM